MNIDRLSKLAGIQPQAQLNEVVDASTLTSIPDVIERLEACKRALSIANRLPDSEDRKKWVRATFINFNKVRAALARLLKEEEGDVMPAAPASNSNPTQSVLH